MNPIQIAFGAMARGFEFLAAASGLSASDLRAMGVPAARARELLRLRDTYFGTTAYRRLRERAMAAGNDHCYDVLLLIESYARRTRTKAQGWRLRAELCGLPANDERAIRRHAARRLKEMSKPRVPDDGVKVTRLSCGKSRLTITASTNDVADMRKVLGGTVQTASDAIFGGGGARPALITNVIVPLPEYAKLMREEGSEMTFQTTHGARVTGAEIVERALKDHGLFTLVSPVDGPVNLYRTQRQASEKQKLMAWAENPTCPWEDCNIPAEEAQIHHIHPWRLGGFTNSKNLSTLCPYHNGVNDDDPAAPMRRGRIERVGGTIRWRPPWWSSG